MATKNDLQRIITDLERIERQTTEPEALRLLSEAKSRLIVLWTTTDVVPCV